MSDEVKIAITLPRETVDTLKSIAASNNWSLADVLTQSVNMNKFLLDHEQRNASILIEGADGRITKVVRK